MTSVTATPVVLPVDEVLSVASSVIQAYPSITSAYLFGSYAKGIARPDSDVDIALFLPDLRSPRLEDAGGVLFDLESALGKEIDLTLRPSDKFVERMREYWIPIKLQRGTATVGPFLQYSWCLWSSDD